MIQLTTKLIDKGTDTWRSGYTFCFTKPTNYELLVGLMDLFAQAEAKCAGYISLRLELPHRPRTTGWKSQNHHLRGHVRQLCGATGYTMTEMMQVVKEDTPSWPVAMRTFHGKKRLIYASEADISMEVASEAIEITHRIAADLGVRLIEESHEETTSRSE